MSNGFQISRGNPRSSSVGEEEDVEEVRYRSTTQLDPSTIIGIEDPGIPLDCDSPGDSFGTQDPCDNLQLGFYNVMGQEDSFRQIDGKRADRGGIGRIVLTTIEETVIEKIEYDLQPADVNNPIFDQEWDVSNFTKTKRHELFVPVSPDSLYAFRITISVEGCPETNTSGIYYLSTGDDVVIEPEVEKLADYIISTLTISTAILQETDILNTDGASTVSPFDGDSPIATKTVTTFASPVLLQEAITITSSYTTS